MHSRGAHKAILRRVGRSSRGYKRVGVFRFFANWPATIPINVLWIQGGLFLAMAAKTRSAKKGPSIGIGVDGRVSDSGFSFSLVDTY